MGGATQRRYFFNFGMKKKCLCILACLCFALLGAGAMYLYMQKDIDYTQTTEILLKSSGWEPVEENWPDDVLYQMTPDNFVGAWTAAKDTAYNIPGFFDPLTSAYQEVAGIWTSDRTDEVTYYSFMARDTTGTLDADLSLQCTIAYYQGQIAMARLVIGIDDTTDSKTKEFYESGLQNSWPLTTDKQQIAQDIRALQDAGFSIGRMK